MYNLQLQLIKFIYTYEDFLKQKINFLFNLK